MPSPHKCFATRALITTQCYNTGTGYPNFFVVFCLKCIFVIDVAVKQLRSGSFLQCGVFAVTMAAHNFFYFQSNQILIIVVSLNSFLYRNVVASGRARPRGLAFGQRSSKETSQRLRTVGYTVSDLTGLGIESQTFRIDSEIF